MGPDRRSLRRRQRGAENGHPSPHLRLCILGFRSLCQYAADDNPVVCGGSWYIETLTNSLTEKAWALLQQVEAAGGIVKALKQELPQKAVAEVLANRFKKMASRADRSVGINMYANMVEKPLEERPLDHAAVQADRSRQIETYCRDLDSMFVAEKLQQICEAGREPAQLMDALVACRRNPGRGSSRAARR